jgi:hypothetical protein
VTLNGFIVVYHGFGWSNLGKSWDYCWKITIQHGDLIQAIFGKFGEY